MDKYEIDNWKRIKESMESAEATDNYFYKRACAIVSGRPDPLDISLDKPVEKGED